jgi:hypothetical protein
MTRVLVAVLVLAAAACGHKQAGSQCLGQVPVPDGCDVACDPAPGAPNTCIAGYHCSPDGRCDAACTPGGNECGVGFMCADDGLCVPDGSGSGDPPIDAGDCPEVHFTATPITPSIQLLIDRSSSMTENFQNQSPSPGNGPYKYPTVQDALVGANGVVTQLEGSVYFGATLFTAFRNACPSLQATPRAKNNRNAILQVISGNPPRLRSDPDPGYTPTPMAIDAVVADFGAHPPPMGSPPVIVLATDGQPNECTTTSPREAESVAAARNAFAHGIKLYILAVSFDDTGARAHVQAMADAGQGVQPGQPHATPYYATNPAQLAAAFQAIIGGVVSCDLKLSGHVDPSDGPMGQLMLNGGNLTYGIDWTLDADGNTVHLLGAACTTLKNSPNPVVNGTFPCGTIIL